MEPLRQSKMHSARMPAPPVFVHSDLHEGFRLMRRLGVEIQGVDIVSSMVQFMSEICEVKTSDLIFPGFNYDFGKSLVFDVEKDPVQVGAIPEALRSSASYQRTLVPFFSSLHAQEAPSFNDTELNLWGETSIFGLLAQQRGTILLFGTGIQSLTFLHHIEASVPGGPLYRYDKIFHGTVRSGAHTKSCSVRMHVRPVGIPLNYDWPKIESLLRATESLQNIGGTAGALAISASSAKDVLLKALSEDPYFMLDDETVERVTKIVEKNSGRLKIEDFE